VGGRAFKPQYCERKSGIEEEKEGGREGEERREREIYFQQLV
jgi:hypothetical protein